MPGKAGIAFIDFENDAQVRLLSCGVYFVRSSALYENPIKEFSDIVCFVLQASVALSGLQGFRVTPESQMRISYAK